MFDIKAMKDVVGKFKTPAFVFDLDALTLRMKEIRQVLGSDVHLCYAMKANPFLVKPMMDLVDKYEVCSPGEFAICEREQVSPDRIVLSGVNKEMGDIVRVMKYAGESSIIYTVESKKHIEVIHKCARESGKKVKVLLRVTSGNQFGMDEAEIEDIISKREKYPYIEFKGIQCYSGTQKKKFSVIEKEIDHLDTLCELLKEKYGFISEEFEYGPGLPVSYFLSDSKDIERSMLKELGDKLNSIKRKYTVTLEMGRYFTACCGTYLTSVADIKNNHGQRYCIVDGGINHLNYYGQAMAMKIPETKIFSQESKEGKEDIKPYTICGSLCTSADVIVKNLMIDRAAPGDIIAFQNTGAYTVTEGIYLFLSRKLPRIILYDGKNGSTLIREALSTDEWNTRQELLGGHNKFT